MRDRARQAFDFFTSRGYSPAASGGIVGNFVGESGLNPGALARGDGSDGSNSIGLGQWNGQRAVNLRRFAQANDLNPSDFNTQLRFTDWELRNTHRSAYDGLMSAKTPTEAAAAFVTQFEKPKGSNRGAEYSHGWNVRNAHANAIASAFGGAPAAQPAQVAQGPSFELLDDEADMPVPNAREAGFVVPPARDGGELTVLPDQAQRQRDDVARSKAGGIEILDDEPMPTAPAAQPPAVAAEPPRSRVRVTLPAVDADPERQARIAEYEKDARANREAQGPVLSTVDTAVRGLARAVPFMDDIAAAGRYATGGADSYQDALDRERAINRVDDTRSPVTSYGTQIAGGLALPGGALASSGLKGAAAVGAGYGALYGAGQGDDVGDRANRAVVGAGLGGALGAGGSAALSGIGAGARFAADKAGIPLGIARGAVDAEAEAARRIGRAAEKDAALPGAQDDAQMFALAREQGQPVTLLDQGGETTRALARSAANTSPEGRGALQNTIGDRNQGQAGRVADFIEQITGTSGDPFAVREGLKAEARAANRPAYARAYAEGSGGLWDEEMQALTAAPAVQQAIAKATKTGANRAVADGFTPPVSPFGRNADGTYALRQKADGSVAYPSLQFWDHVKRNLDDAYTVAQRQGRNSEAADIDALRKQLVGGMDDRVPSYASARAGAARAFGAQDASEAGEKFLSLNMTVPDARRAVSGLSEPEKKLFADGFASSLIDKVRTMPDRRDVVNSVFGTPKAREKVEIALGRERASRLEAFLRVENMMTMAGRAVTGNSTTARQLAEMGLAGGVGAAGGFTFGGDGKDVALGAILGGLARKGSIKIDERVARRVGEMLSSTDPDVVRKVTEQIGRQPAMMNLVKSAEEWLSSTLPRVAQPQGPDVRLIGGPRASMASDGQDQPPNGRP